jgi:peptidoglycan L-alanyl-D-glutamate endopeptidase CwlK
VPRFGAVSRANLAEVHPDLQQIYNIAIQHWDCAILDGDRTVAEQRKNVAKGVSKTMNSKHIGGFAVDAMPFPVDWNAIQKGLDAIKKADGGMQVAEAYMFQGFIAGIAAALGIKVRQGVDWDSDRDFANQTFHDLPHTELAG